MWGGGGWGLPRDHRYMKGSGDRCWLYKPSRAPQITQAVGNSKKRGKKISRAAAAAESLFFFYTRLSSGAGRQVNTSRHTHTHTYTHTVFYLCVPVCAWQPSADETKPSGDVCLSILPFYSVFLRLLPMEACLTAPCRVCSAWACVVCAAAAHALAAAVHLCSLS